MAQDFNTILTAFQDKLDELVLAVEAEDWPLAFKKLIAAKACRAKIIESEISDQGSSLKNSDDLLRSMDTLLSAAEVSAAKKPGMPRFAYSRNSHGMGG